MNFIIVKFINEDLMTIAIYWISLSLKSGRPSFHVEKKAFFLLTRSKGYAP